MSALGLDLPLPQQLTDRMHDHRGYVDREPRAMKSEFIDNHRNRGDAASMTTDNKSIVERALAESGN
jgi:hypothetical protein